jgi:hypothetical protein
VPWETLREHPWAGLAAGLPAFLVLLIGCASIARMSACEFSQSVILPWTRALNFALTRWAAVIFSVLGPLVVAGLLLGVVALLGGVFFNWSISAVVGAVGYGPALLLGLLAALILTGFAVGGHLLVPAVACEGTDAIDAAQRAYAYVIGRPLRLAIFQAISLALMVVSVVLVEWLALGTVRLTSWSAGWLTGADAHAALAGVRQEGGWGIAARILEFWHALPGLLAGAFVLSYGVSASTIQYLLLRKLNDGQDVSEIWMPGLIGGTLAPEKAPPAVATDDDDEDD